MAPSGHRHHTMHADAHASCVHANWSMTSARRVVQLRATRPARVGKIDKTIGQPSQGEACAEAAGGHQRALAAEPTMTSAVWLSADISSSSSVSRQRRRMTSHDSIRHQSLRPRVLVAFTQSLLVAAAQRLLNITLPLDRATEKRHVTAPPRSQSITFPDKINMIRQEITAK